MCSDALRHHLQHFLTHPHSFTIDTLLPTAKFPPSCHDPSSPAEGTWISHALSAADATNTRHLISAVPRCTHCTQPLAVWTPSLLGRLSLYMEPIKPFSYVSLFPFRFGSSTPYSALTPFTAFPLQHRRVSFTLVVHAPIVAHLTIFQQVFSVLDTVILVIVVLTPYPPALPVFTLPVYSSRCSTLAYPPSLASAKAGDLTQLSHSFFICVPLPQASYAGHIFPSCALGSSESQPSFLFPFLSNSLARSLRLNSLYHISPILNQRGHSKPIDYSWYDGMLIICCITITDVLLCCPPRLLDGRFEVSHIADNLLVSKVAAARVT